MVGRNCWDGGQVTSFRFFQHALAFHDVLVVPLDLSGFCKPALKFDIVDLCRSGEIYLRRLELAFRFQLRLVKRLPAPEQQLHTGFSHPITNNWIVIDEPHGATVPDFGSGLRQAVRECCGEMIADRSIGGELGSIIGGNGGGLGCGPRHQVASLGHSDNLKACIAKTSRFPLEPF